MQCDSSLRATWQIELIMHHAMLNQITILKTLLFSSGMASQGETWPFQEGLVRAHWQNVRPLQMSQ